MASLFRQEVAAQDTDFWNDDMEDMLELKQANPIYDDSVDFGGDRVERSAEGGRITPRL